MGCPFAKDNGFSGGLSTDWGWFDDDFESKAQGLFRGDDYLSPEKFFATSVKRRTKKATTSKNKNVTVSTNNTTSSWSFTPRSAGISYNNTSSGNTLGNNYSVFRNTNVNTNAQGSLTHNVFRSGYKKLPLPNYNTKKIPLLNYNVKRMPLPWPIEQHIKRLLSLLQGANNG